MIEGVILDLSLEFTKWCVGKLSEEKMVFQLPPDIASKPTILFTCFHFYND